MHILVAIPHNYIGFDVNFTMSLLGAQQRFYEWVIANKREDTISIVRQSGYQIDEMRNSLVDIAKEYKRTHILFLDTDMSFPQDMIPMMIEDLEDNPKHDAVTGLYVKKKPPYLPHVYPSFLKTKKFSIAGAFPTEGIFEVAGAGMGCILIKMDVFKRKPYFKMGGSAGGAKALGEDLFFFAKFRPKTLCDTRISCNHYMTTGVNIGTYIQSNELKVKDGQITMERKQLDEILKKHKE